MSALANPAATGPTAPITFDLRYPGQLADAESGLFYNHYRRWPVQAWTGKPAIRAR